MNTQQAFLKGFVKRAGAYGISVKEANDMLQRGQYHSNPQISTEINALNSNPNKSPGSAAIMDYRPSQLAAGNRPAYSPSTVKPHQGPATYIESIPVLGHVAGPPARLLEHDPVGAGLGLATDVAAIAPGGLGAAGLLMGASKLRDLNNYLTQKSNIAAQTEASNRIPRD